MHRAIETGFWAVAAAAALGAAVGWRAAVPTRSTSAAPSLAPPPTMHGWPADSLAQAAKAVVAGDPFRVARRPADVPFRAVPDGTPPSPPPPPKPPKPALAVVGLVGGPPWAALLDGVPGRTGSVVVHAGDVLGALTIRAVGTDTVIVQGADTTWTLTLRHPWQ